MKFPVYSKRKTTLANLRVSVYLGFLSWVKVEVTEFASLRSVVRRTLYDRYFPFLVSREGEVTNKMPRGHFMTLTEVNIHLINLV